MHALKIIFIRLIIFVKSFVVQQLIFFDIFERSVQFQIPSLLIIKLYKTKRIADFYFCHFVTRKWLSWLRSLSWRSLPSWPTPMRVGNEFLSVEGLIISWGKKQKKTNSYWFMKKAILIARKTTQLSMFKTSPLELTVNKDQRRRNVVYKVTDGGCLYIFPIWNKKVK